MSETTLYRRSALAGLLASAVLVVNVLRRDGALPTDAVTHAVAPLAPVLALFAVTGLYLWVREATGLVGLLGYVLSTAGFAGAVGSEVVVQFVFANMPKAQVDGLVAGPSRPALVVIAVVFTLGAVLLGAALARSGQAPTAAAVGYLVTMAVFAWRSALPEWIVTVDGVLSAVIVARLSLALRHAFPIGTGEQESSRDEPPRPATDPHPVGPPGRPGPL